ncbi:Lrp/AsnC family transcriptional regulator [Streptomyces sp. BE308]|uniref:Lrp/AsnC family transcriptional regulator n=1 Tax=unclassified Streptomyces TaxID=2593676 RepID=UPI002DD8BC88|nr:MULTISPECIES: Lrp/AsnC family transcriptional regulator [unclassified Streptomyces]MEE1793495.1 Lrp/AsnC family transcriptional regulator [Streptomyces sp. BE308]WRZ71078.1 Lrp/AsnC family transcriptional regulator [Streptomyces sp. NBC_01237]
MTENLPPLSELDLALINALQINPRAPWTELAKALDVDAATVARRWERVRTAGHAWVTAYPYGDAGGGALIEIDCAPGQAGAVAAILSADPHAVTVEHAAGGRDLLITAMATSFGALSRYIVDRLGTIPGIIATRAHLVTRSYTEGSVWRLTSLSRSQQEVLAASRRAAAGSSNELPEYADLVTAIGENGRISLSELADQLGISVNTASRRLNRLLESGKLVLRCDLARSLSGSPVAVTFFGTVAAEHLDATARELAKLPEIRQCLGLAGPQNLIATVWVSSLVDAQALEVRLAAALPHLRIADRAVALRAVKLMGRLLDPEGRAVGFVPMNLWASQ